MPATHEPSTGRHRQAAWLGGADYELRLLNGNGRTVHVLRSRQPDDQSARETILRIRNIDYNHYELWRGMTKIDEGPGFVIIE